MTIIEAINRADAVRHNALAQGEKVRALSELDGRIKLEIIDTHEGGEGIVYTGYGEGTPLQTVLIVPEPWSDLYIKWLETKINYAEAEYDGYNNALAAFNAAWEAFAKWYNRTHMPKTARFKYI